MTNTAVLNTAAQSILRIFKKCSGLRKKIKKRRFPSWIRGGASVGGRGRPLESETLPYNKFKLFSSDFYHKYELVQLISLLES